MPTPSDSKIDYRYIDDSEPISNMMEVHKRDDGGNIIIMDQSTRNKILVIEPIKKQYTVETVLRVLDTNFEYYSFPVQTTETNAIEIPDLDIADIEQQLLDLQQEQEKDIVTREYSIVPTYDENNDAERTRRVNTTTNSKWYYSSEKISKGYKRLPFKFKDQEKVGTYELTKEMIEYIRKQNQVLRFQIYIQLEPDPVLVSNSTTIKELRYYMRLNRREIAKRTPGGNFLNGAIMPIVYKLSRNVWDVPVLYLEYVIDPNDMIAGDMYYVEAMTDHPSSVIVDECWWRANLIPAPKALSLFGSPINNRLQYGVTKFGWDPGTKLINNRNETQAIWSGNGYIRAEDITAEKRRAEKVVNDLKKYFGGKVEELSKTFVTTYSPSSGTTNSLLIIGDAKTQYDRQLSSIITNNAIRDEIEKTEEKGKYPLDLDNQLYFDTEIEKIRLQQFDESITPSVKEVNDLVSKNVNWGSYYDAVRIRTEGVNIQTVAPYVDTKKTWTQVLLNYVGIR